MEFSFEKGGDLRIAVNGAPLGGVLSLERAVKNDADVISEFLTDKPVALFPHREYTLTFSLRCAGACVFESEIERIAVADSKKTEVYTDCAVRELSGKACARGWVEYTAVVDAKERSVLHE